MQKDILQKLYVEDDFQQRLFRKLEKSLKGIYENSTVLIIWVTYTNLQKYIEDRISREKANLKLAVLNIKAKQKYKPVIQSVQTA